MSSLSVESVCVGLALMQRNLCCPLCEVPPWAPSDIQQTDFSLPTAMFLRMNSPSPGCCSHLLTQNLNSLAAGHCWAHSGRRPSFVPRVRKSPGWAGPQVLGFQVNPLVRLAVCFRLLLQESRAFKVFTSPSSLVGMKPAYIFMILHS